MNMKQKIGNMTLEEWIAGLLDDLATIAPKENPYTWQDTVGCETRWANASWDLYTLGERARYLKANIKVKS